MKAKIKAFCFSLILILFGPLYLKSDDISVCRAANETVDYGEILAVPNALKTIIDHYRDSWKKACSNPRSDDFSLSVLLSRAKEIESQFTMVIDGENRRFRQNAGAREGRDRAIKIDAILREKYPAFIPGFRGSYMEWSYFKPSLKKFSEAVQLGNDEDRAFFKHYSDDGLFPPWIKGTWDYGGCRRYGRFKWVEHIRTTLDLRNNLKSKGYDEINSEYLDGMIDELTEDRDICTCDKKEGVLPDLVAVSDFLRDQAEFRPAYKAIKERIVAIQTGKMEIRSEAEGHCSGG